MARTTLGGRKPPPKDEGVQDATLPVRVRNRTFQGAYTIVTEFQERTLRACKASSYKVWLHLAIQVGSRTEWYIADGGPAIARELGMSIRTFRYATAELVEHGLLEIRHRIFDGTQYENAYTILDPGPHADPPTPTKRKRTKKPKGSSEAGSGPQESGSNSVPAPSPAELIHKGGAGKGDVDACFSSNPQPERRGVQKTAPLPTQPVAPHRRRATGCTAMDPLKDPSHEGSPVAPTPVGTRGKETAFGHTDGGLPAPLGHREQTGTASGLHPSRPSRSAGALAAANDAAESASTATPNGDGSPTRTLRLLGRPEDWEEGRDLVEALRAGLSAMRGRLASPLQTPRSGSGVRNGSLRRSHAALVARADDWVMRRAMDLHEAIRTEAESYCACRSCGAVRTGFDASTCPECGGEEEALIGEAALVAGAEDYTFDGQLVAPAWHDGALVPPTAVLMRLAVGRSRHRAILGPWMRDHVVDPRP